MNGTLFRYSVIPKCMVFFFSNLTQNFKTYPVRNAKFLSLFTVYYSHTFLYRASLYRVSRYTGPLFAAQLLVNKLVQET